MLCGDRALGLPLLKGRPDLLVDVEHLEDAGETGRQVESARRDGQPERVVQAEDVPVLVLRRLAPELLPARHERQDGHHHARRYQPAETEEKD